jgi:hypothetical protein
LIVVKSGGSSGILQREIEPSNLIIPMNDQSSIKLAIAFNDPDLEPEERDEQAQRFLAELKQVDEVESVERLLDPNPPEGNKSLGGFLVGMLLAEVNPANGKKLLGFLGDRLGGKPIELSVEANGRKLTVKAHSREELEAAIKAAQDFILG